MPGVELAAFGSEDAREDFVVLKTKCLDARHERLEGEGERVAQREHDDRDNDVEHATAVPEVRGPGPDERAECRVGQAEGRETGEGDGVGAEAQQAVEEFYTRLERARRPTARFGEQADEAECEGEDGECRTREDY